MGIFRPADAGLALWRANDCEVAWLRGGGNSDAGAGNRREHRTFFGGQRRALESIALSGAGATRGATRKQAKLRDWLDRAPELPRLAERQPHVFHDGDLAGLLVQPDGAGGRRTAEGGIRFDRLSAVARCEAGPGPHVR